MYLVNYVPYDLFRDINAMLRPGNYSLLILSDRDRDLNRVSDLVIVLP